MALVVVHIDYGLGPYVSFSTDELMPLDTLEASRQLFRGWNLRWPPGQPALVTLLLQPFVWARALFDLPLADPAVASLMLLVMRAFSVLLLLLTLALVYDVAFELGRPHVGGICRRVAVTDAGDRVFRIVRQSRNAASVLDDGQLVGVAAVPEASRSAIEHRVRRRRRGQPRGQRPGLRLLPRRTGCGVVRAAQRARPARAGDRSGDAGGVRARAWAALGVGAVCRSPDDHGDGLALVPDVSAVAGRSTATGAGDDEGVHLGGGHSTRGGVRWRCRGGDPVRSRQAARGADDSGLSRITSGS